MSEYGYRAVTRFRNPPPRDPEVRKPQGIYGTADIGIELNHSPDFFAALESMLSQQWGTAHKVEAEARKAREKKEQASQEALKSRKRGKNAKPTNVSRVCDYLRDNPGKTPKEIADGMGNLSRRQVTHALSALRTHGHAEIISTTGAGGNYKAHWRLVEGDSE